MSLKRVTHRGAALAAVGIVVAVLLYFFGPQLRNAIGAERFTILLMLVAAWFLIQGLRLVVGAITRRDTDSPT